MTMTSFTLIAMFLMLNIVDVPAVYLTGQSACITIAFMWLTIMLSFSAMCCLDLKRQEAKRWDIICCMSSPSEEDAPDGSCGPLGFIFRQMYMPVVMSTIGQIIVLVATLGLLAASGYGLSTTKSGLGISDFAKDGSELSEWTTVSEKYFGYWPMNMYFKNEDNSFLDTEMHLKMIKNYENVAAGTHVSANTSQEVLFASMALWGLHPSVSTLYNIGDHGLHSNDYCNKSNCSFHLWADPPVGQIKVDGTADANGYLMPTVDLSANDNWVYDASKCVSKFQENTHGLHLYSEPGQSIYIEQGLFSGICQPGQKIIDALSKCPVKGNGAWEEGGFAGDGTSVNHAIDPNKEYCPVMDFESEDVFVQCFALFKNFSGEFATHAMAHSELEDNGRYCDPDDNSPDGSGCGNPDSQSERSRPRIVPKQPVQYITAGGLSNNHLFETTDYTEMIETSRKSCDDLRGSDDPTCFLTGTAFSYWEQYLSIEEWLIFAIAASTGVGFVVVYVHVP